MSSLRRTILLYWVLMTSCLHHLQPCCPPSSTRACVQDANAGSLHDGPGLSTATVCGLSNSCVGEPTAFTHHFLLVVRELHLYIDSDTSPSTQLGPQVRHKNSCFKAHSRCHSHRNCSLWHHNRHI